MATRQLRDPALPQMKKPGAPFNGAPAFRHDFTITSQLGFMPFVDTSTGPDPFGRGFSVRTPRRRATS